jgi:hypothetical protein
MSILWISSVPIVRKARAARASRLHPQRRTRRPQLVQRRAALQVHERAAFCGPAEQPARSINYY